MKDINQSSMRTLSGLPGTKWNRDGDTVYVYVTLKYIGDGIWLRPWGGPASGKWIPFAGLWSVNMLAY
jgi:hypothetical protein